MTIATDNKNAPSDLCMTYAPVSNVRFVCGIAMLCYMSLTAFALGDEQVDYASQIKPLLQARCFACHGALRQEAGLRLDTAAAIHAGGDSGAAVTPGDVSASLLIERVSALDIDQRMPPEFEGEQLSPTEVQLLSGWITQGATAPENEKAEIDPKDHWAFQPIRRPRVPSQSSPENTAATPTANSAWGKNPIDAFIAEQHRLNGLTVQEPAPRSILLRRLYLDLIGIPPSPEAITAAAAATGDDWYAQTVEDLLNDPRHGERWARHWMDIWRYSDWWGLGEQLRNSQKHIWHWRDWIIESLNNDVAYDEMLRSMLAADELYPEDQSQLRATGYLARNYFLFNRPQWMEETVEHVSKGFLGLTLNCAKCHDHKYDPVTHADFYRMRAFFEPYHVRMDMLPGESDLERDGLPRVFESQLIAPTYLYIRGQETNPDKSREILPGIPDFLALDDLPIQPVELPSSAWQPERQPWVIDNHMATATAKLESAQRALDVAHAQLVTAEQQAAEVGSKTIDSENAEAAADLNANSIHDTFDAWDTVQWREYGGQWQHQPGQVHQLAEGESQAALRWTQAPPEDFDATIRFTITGGSQWRSVCLAFDVTQEDPTASPTPQDTEQMVYVSAHAGSPKIQAAFHQGGAWQFPAAARQSKPIVLNREYLLHVQVRGQLINASLDGQPAFAWQTPLARRSGFLQLSTFDAAVVLHEVTVNPLASGTRLLPAVNDGDPSNPAMLVALAQSDVEVAQAKLAVAQADQARVRAIASAMRAEWAAADNPDSDQLASLNEAAQDCGVEAVLAERKLAAANAQLAVNTAEQAVLRATSEKPAADQALVTARTALDQAHDLARSDVATTDDFTKLIGAQWTPTRFLDSGKDDPNIEFAQRSSGRRSALAGWITDARNPLTARVAANHIWSRHMGQPLVASVFDFGRNGASPTHPELLDWLACELIEHDWSMKHLHRLIVNSATYRLSSATSGLNSVGASVTTNQQLDPDNQFWWRRSAIRLESQVVRDSILSLGGNLDASIGGPSIAPAEQADSLRRSLYFFHSNNDRNLFLSTFDEAMVKDCYRREQSIVPQQALALTNSRLVLQQSELIAQRLSLSNQAEQCFIRSAFHELLGFEPGDAELAAASLALEGWRSLPDGSESAARAQLIWALINHNDFVTLR